MSVRAAMKSNSENWARIERTKARLGNSAQDNAQREKLAARQAALAKENQRLAKADFGVQYKPETGEWLKRGTQEQAYAPAVRPPLSRPKEVKRAMTDVQNAAQRPVQLPTKKQDTPKRVDMSRLTLSPDYVPGTQIAADTREHKANVQPEDNFVWAHATPGQRIKRAGEVTGRNVMGGIGGFTSAMYSTADFFLPDFATPKAAQEYMENAVESGRKVKEYAREKNLEQGGKAGQLAGDGAMLLVEMIPQVAAAAATAGGSTGAQLGAKAGAVAQLLKNPSALLSFARQAGPEFERAKAEGASDLEATITALTSAAGQTAIELAGGLETAKGARGIGSVIKGGLEEGAEEVFQGITPNLTSKAVYDKDKPYFSMEDPDAVINPIRSAEEFAMGATMGTAMGGARALGGKLIDGLAESAHSRAEMDAMLRDAPQTRVNAVPMETVTEQANTPQTAAGTEMRGKPSVHELGALLTEQAAESGQSAELPQPAQRQAEVRHEALRQAVTQDAPLVSDGVLYLQKDQSGQYTLPKGRSYRIDLQGKGSPMSDWGHAMFADDSEGQFADAKESIDAGTVYSIDQSKLTDISALKNMIAETWDADRQDQLVANGTYLDDHYYDYDGLEVAESFDPKNILDSADAYDDSNFVQWLWARVLEPNDIFGVKTSDGAIVFDESMIDSVKGSNAPEQANTPQAAAQAIPATQAVPQQAVQSIAQKTPVEVAQPVQPIARPEVRTMNRTPDYDITGYTLSDAAVNLGNTLAESGDPVAALNDLKQAYQPAYDRAIQSASEYVASYKPQGVAVVGVDEYGRGGYRASQNDPWYSEFYKKNGHAPRKSDIPQIAEQLVRADQNGSQFGFQAKSMQMLETISELENRVLNRDGFTGFTENAQGDVQAVYGMDVGMAGKVSAEATTGAAPAGFDPYTRMANEYGTIKPGENPARIVDVPKSTDGSDRVRRFTRTMMEAEATPESMIADFERLVETGQASYNPRNNKTDLDSAVKYIEQNGFERSLAAWNEKMESRGSVDTDDLIRAQIMYAAAAKEGDTQTAMRLAGQMAAEYTKAGQAVQSARILKKATPEGRLYYIRRSVENLQSEIYRSHNRRIDSGAQDMTAAEIEAVTSEAVKAAATDAQDDLLAEADAIDRGGKVSIDHAAMASKMAQDGLWEQIDALYEVLGETFSGKGRDHGTPVEDWKTEIGRSLAMRLAARLRARNETRTVASTITSDLVKFAEEHALPQRPPAQPRKSVDRLTDYFNNREAYTRAWNAARELLREKYRNNQSALDKFETFLNSGTIDYNGEVLHEQHVIVRAILDEIKKTDPGMKKALDRAALGASAQDIQAVEDALVSQTGVTGADEMILRQAIQRNMGETVAVDPSRVPKIIKAAVRELNLNLNGIAESNALARKKARAQVAAKIAAEYKVDRSFVDDVTLTVSERFNELVAESAERKLESLFKARGAAPKPEFWDTFRKYGNLGAFDSQYAQEASRKLFGSNEIVIDSKLAQNVLNAKSEAELTAAADALMKDVAQQIPGTWADKINAWRYFSMLGNPRTHFRNLVGNFVFSLPVATKNKIGAVLETAFIRDGERTKSILPADKITQDFAKADAAKMMDVLKGGGKYNPADIIREHQDPFSPKWLLGRALNKASKANSNALDAEDAFFLGRHYRNALAGYMKANNLTAADMHNELGAATVELEKARTYAINEAQKATFRDASAVADALARFEKTNAGTKILMGGLVPFKKTPINIVKRGVEYSPIGLIDGLKQAAVDVRRGTKTPSEALDRIASGLTGTGLMVLGAFLAEQGMLSGASAEERKEQYLNDAEGMQSYSLDLGSHTYTVDWSAPASLPLFMGVEMHNAMRDGFDGFPALVDAMQNITEPIFNLTMMDGVQGAIRAAAYGGDNAITAAAGNMVSDYLGQFVPTASGQIARTIDGTRRTPYKGNEITGFPSVDVWLQRQQAKIPGASKSLAPYMDVFGRTSEEKPIAMRAFENMLSPGYIAKKKPDGTTAGLRELYSSTGDGAVLPNKPDTSFSVDGENIVLSQDQYVKYVQSRGQTIQTGLNDLFSSAAYDTMGDADRIAAVRKLYDYATADAKAGVSKYEMDNTQKRAKASGVSVGTFYAYKQQLDSLKDSKDPAFASKVANVIAGDKNLNSKEKDSLIENLVIHDYGQTAADDYKSIYSADLTPAEYVDLRESFTTVDKDGARTAPKALTYKALGVLGGKNEQENAGVLEGSGLGLAEYYAVKKYKSSLTGDNQKDRVIQWMRDEGWTGEQINAAGAALGYKMVGTSKKSSKAKSSGAKKTPVLGRPRAPQAPKAPKLP